MQTQVKTNRRLTRRAMAKGSVKLISRKGRIDMGPNIAVSLLDVSETGLRMVATEPLELDQELTVCLESVVSRKPVRLVARVIWSVETAEGKFAVGVRFEKRLPYGEWQKMT